MNIQEIEILKNTKNHLIFRHRPFLHWITLLGVLLASLFFAIFKADMYPDFMYELHYFITLLLIFVILYLIFIYFKSVICEFDKSQGYIFITKKGLISSEVYKENLRNIRTIKLTLKRLRGGYGYKIYLVMNSGKRVAMNISYLRDSSSVQSIVESVCSFLDLSQENIYITSGLRHPEIINSTEESISLDTSKYQVLFIILILFILPVLYLNFYPGKSLIDAAESGNIIAVKKYLERGGNPNTSNLLTLNALCQSIFKEHDRISELLINSDANVNTQCSGNTPLHVAVGNIKIMKLLINNGANVNAKDENYATPLHWAAWRNNFDTAALLIAKGADVNARNIKGETPLDQALQKNHSAIVELLRRNGATE